MKIRRLKMESTTFGILTLLLYTIVIKETKVTLNVKTEQKIAKGLI